MAIAGALVVPVDRQNDKKLEGILNAIEGVEVMDIGPKGLAIVLEAKTSARLKAISEKINNLDEVVEFSVGYVNWEDESETTDSQLTT